MRTIDGITITTYHLSLPFSLFAKGMAWHKEYISNALTEFDAIQEV